MLLTDTVGLLGIVHKSSPIVEYGSSDCSGSGPEAEIIAVRRPTYPCRIVAVYSRLPMPPTAKLCEREAGGFMNSLFAGHLLPTPDDPIDIFGFQFDTVANATGFSAAMLVEPEPANGPSTVSPRLVQSLMASAKRVTGLTVGLAFKSPSRPLPNEVTQ